MRTFITLFGFFITTSLFAQSSFRLRFITPDFGSIRSIVQLSDGNYAGVGYLNDDIYLVKISVGGELIISKKIGTSGYDDGVSIIRTSDDNLAVGGVLNDQMAIIKMDDDLNPIWSKTYPAGDNSYGYHLLQTADGGYMLSGYTNQNDKFAGYLVKTNSDGNVLMAKQYFDFGNSALTDVVATSDGNYALLGDASANSSGKDSSYLIKINPSGAVIWSAYLNTSANSQYPSSLLQASDGGLVMTGLVYQTSKSPGVTDTGTYTFQQMLMAKYSSSGSLLWSKKMSPSKTSESYSYEVAEDSDGGYIFSGGLSLFTNKLVFQNNNSFLVKLSSAGSLVWTKTLDASASSYTDFTDIIKVDNGYAVCGYTDDTDDPDNDLEDGIFYKFDASFSTCGSVESFGSVDDIGTAVANSIATKDLTVVSAITSVTEVAAGSLVNVCSVLPLQLLSFNATLQNKNVAIEWKTANETNTRFFVVERRANGSSFTELQKTDAKGTSSSTQTYTATDPSPAFGTSYYRLKQADNNGAVVYSNVVPVTISSNGTIVISPNPVHNDIRVLIQATTNAALNLQVADMTGRIVATQSTKVSAGTNTVLIPASSFAKGTYLLKVTGDNITRTIKFGKQ